jgi:molybdopterin adenylyltransferase
MRIAILTISDAGARGERADTSGDAIVEWAGSKGYELAKRDLVPDDVVAIASRLTTWADAGDADLILTTGGTGLSARDVTPEATRAVIERDAPGIAERIRVSSLTSVPNAALSRGVSGTRAKSLIINLPGSPSGVRDALTALDPIVDHAIGILRGDATEHAPPASRRAPRA